MKKLMFAAALLAMTSMTTGCLLADPDEERPTWEIDEEVEQTEEEEEQEPKLTPELSAVFVGGHLGNYMDCPEDGYTERNASMGGGLAPADAAFGACAPDAESCETILNCEAAQLTVKITNDGQAAAEGLSVETIALLDEDGQVAATLPLIDAIDTQTGEPFDGQLEVGADVTLRLDYQGPRDIQEFLPGQNRWSGSTTLELTFGADNHEDVRLETREVQVLPTVVT